MRRSLPATGLLISAVLLLFSLEAVLLFSLFDEPPKQHSDALLAAGEEADRNPTSENYQRLGELVYQEARRPAWKDPVAIQYYCELLFVLVLNLFIITRLLVRLGLRRDPIVSRHAIQQSTAAEPPERQ